MDEIQNRLVRMETRLCRGFEALGINMDANASNTPRLSLTVFADDHGDIIAVSHLAVTLLQLQKFCEHEGITTPTRVEFNGRTVGVFHPAIPDGGAVPR